MSFHADPRENTIHKSKQSQKGRQKSAELIVREEIGSRNDYYRSLLLFPNMLYKETEMYFL